MKGLYLCLFGCLFAGFAWAQDEAALPQMPPRAYQAHELYELALLQADVWNTRFAQSPMKMYNPLTYSGERHTSRVDTRKAALTKPMSDPVYFFSLWLVLLMLAILFAKNQAYVRLMLQSVVNFRLSLQFAREQVATRTFASLLYILAFNLLLALFFVRVFHQNKALSLELWSYTGFGLLLGGITLVYTFKYVFYKFLGVLFQMKEAVSYYLSMVFLINRVQGLLLLLLLAFVYFSSSWASNAAFYTAVVLLCLGLVWRYVLAIRFTRQIVRTHVFHFILYFCAVELIPTAVIAKFLLNV